MPVSKKSLANLKPAKKGEVRNPHGAPRRIPSIDKLLAEVLGEETNGTTAAQSILMALMAKAAKGDVRAAEALLDRAYGKAKQESKIDQTSTITVIYDGGLNNLIEPADTPSQTA